MEKVKKKRMESQRKQNVQKIRINNETKASLDELAKDYNLVETNVATKACDVYIKCYRKLATGFATCEEETMSDAVDLYTSLYQHLLLPTVHVQMNCDEARQEIHLIIRDKAVQVLLDFSATRDFGYD